MAFTVDNPEAKQAEARQKAIDQAKQKAKTLASQLGVSLGKIQSFSEGGGYEPRPMMMNAMAAGVIILLIAGGIWIADSMAMILLLRTVHGS